MTVTLIPASAASTTTTYTTSDGTGKKKGRTVTVTTEDMQKRKNDVKARTTLLLSLPDEHQLRFTEGSETLEQMFNRLQVIVGQLQFMDVEIEQDDLNQKFLTSLAPEWLMHTIKKSETNSQKMAFISSTKHNRGNEDVHTASVSTASTNVPAARVNIGVASISQDTTCAYIDSQSSGSQIKFEDINQIEEDDMEEMDIKWNMALLSMRADKFWKKISIQGTDVAGFDKSKVECFNCHKMGHFARECRAPRSQDKGRRDNYRQESKVEEQAPKALSVIDGVGWDWSYMANDEDNHALVADKEAPIEFALMANISVKSKVFDNSLCSKNCKRNVDSLNSKITDLTDKLFNAKNMIYHYKLGLAQVESRLVEHKDREIKYCEKIKGLELELEFKTNSLECLAKELETLKKEKEGLDGKLAGFQTASKDIDSLLKSQRLDKNKEGLGYSVVPPLPAQIYYSLKKDMSWIGLPEFKDDTVTDYSRPASTIESSPDDAQNRNPSVAKEASPSTISPKSFIKFVKTNDSPTKSKIDKAEKAKKSYVKYAEQYRKPTKKPNVRGNQRNWNNLKSHQLGPNFVMKKNACFNCGDFNHLAYDCRKRVKRETSRSQNTTHKSFTPRPVVHKPYRPLMRRVRHNLVGGLPTKCFENNHTCTACLKGKQHKATLTDDFSRFTFTFFLKTKDETSGLLRKFIIEIENLKDLKLKIIRTLIEAARTMLADAKLHVTFWAEAVNTACYVQNRDLVKESQNKTPYELFNGRTPTIGFLKPFGCHVMILNTLDNLGKFKKKGDEGYFIGYSMSSKTFRVFNKRTRKVEENLHVYFLENKAIVKGAGPNWLFDIDSLTKSMNYVPVDAGTTSTNLSGIKDAENQEVKKNVSSLRYIALPNWVHDALLESSSNESNGVEADVSNMETTITASPTPTLRIHKDHPKSQIIGHVDTLIQTKNKSKKVEVMQEEILQFKIQNVWTLVDCPKGVRPIGTKWVLKNKKDERGIVIRNKVRLVAQGHTQEEGINYDKVFAPVARIGAIRLFLAYASFMGFTVYQMDVKSAFLYGTIDEEVRQRGDFILIQVYVDDIIFGSSNSQLCREFEALMHEKFQMSAMGELNFFLVLQVLQKKDGIFLSQDKHQVTPKECHLHAVKRIFRYLKGHPKLGLWYPKEYPFDLVAYSDSDYGGATQDRKSTTKGCQFLGRRNKEMNDFCSQKGIKREFSNARTLSKMFKEKWDEGYFIGYSMSSKAFRVFNKRTRRVEENLHVEFLENKAIEKASGPNWLFDIDSLTKSMNYVLVDAGTISTNLSGIKDAASQEVRKNEYSLRYIALPNWAHDALLEYSLGKPQDHCSTEVPKGSGNPNPTASTSNPPADQMDTLTVETPIPTASLPVPTAYSTDSQEPSSDARLISKRVANQVETPSLDNILSLTNRFEDILRVTTNSDESNRVEADISNMETAITASPTPTLRIHKDHPKSQIIGPMDTPIQTRNKSKEVLKNKKDERGIVIRNKARLVAQGNTQEERIDYDEVFAPISRIEAIRLFLAYASFMGFIVYQMDVKSAFLYGTTDEELCKEFEALMHEKFHMSAMGELNFFLGLQVLQKKDGIFLSQDKYVGDILKKFGYSKVRSSNTPMDKENPWGKNGTGKDVDIHLYRSMIGSLMYLTKSIPDIMFAVCACARHQVTPKECHLHAVNRIFRYLKGHPKLGLWYPKESPFDLIAYSDSDYGGATQDRKSTTRECPFLGRRLILWQCKKKTIIATSTTEAEYVAAANCCGQVLWIQNQLLHYRLSMPCEALSREFSTSILRLLIPLGEGSGTLTEPHHTPSPKAHPTSHTTYSSPILPPVTTASILTVTPSETTTIRQCTRRARIAQSSALSPVADEPASPLRDVSEGKACPTESSLGADQDRATIAKTSTLPYDSAPMVTSHAAAEGKRFGDDAQIKGRNLDEGEVVAERVSDDTEEMATVLTFMETATVLASGAAEVPTSSGCIPTAGSPATDVPTDSNVVPTASLVFATATVVTPYRRTGKEIMVESETLKKKKVQEQIDAQVARELEEQMAREDQRMSEHVDKDAEEYEQFAGDLSIRERAELINNLIKYQENYAQILKFQTQQRKPWSKKQKTDYYMAVIKSNLGWKVKDFRGMTFEKIEAKFTTVWKQLEDFIPMGSKEEAERLKRKGLSLEQEKKVKDIMQLVPIKEVYVESLQVKHPIIDWKHMDREDLNQLWALVKESFSNRQPTSDKKMELWVELKRFYELDDEDQLWTHTQNLMHAPFEWKLYDMYGVHQVTSKDKEIFMLVEKDYPLRKGLAIMMICYKLQVENYSQMANDLILKIYKIANCPSQQVIDLPLAEEVPTASEESSHCQKKRDATAKRIALLRKTVIVELLYKTPCDIKGVI
nr:putative ribonuclease H-like domain-containing protein [Tanacetum cinerariifolium]